MKPFIFLIAFYNGSGTVRCLHNGRASVPEKAAGTLRTLNANPAFYRRLAKTVKRNAKGAHVLYGFCPDHGCHEIDGGHGSHGLDMDEDMNVIHFYGLT